MTKGHRLRKGTKAAEVPSTGDAGSGAVAPSRADAATRSADAGHTPAPVDPTPVAVADLANPAAAPAPLEPVRLVAGSDAVRRTPRPPMHRAGHDGSHPTTSSRALGWPTLGLVGRVEWERLVADEAERQRRYGRPSAIVLAEVRGLDRVTAQAGSRGIERVVPPCGATLVAIARASDRVTRLGDGRFGILLREADADGAGRYAERARTACDDWLAALPWPVDLAVRWAAPGGNEDLVGALRRAERELADATMLAALSATAAPSA